MSTTRSRRILRLPIGPTRSTPLVVQSETCVLQARRACPLTFSAQDPQIAEPHE